MGSSPASKELALIKIIAQTGAIRIKQVKK
jgi:hypothetical protein